MEIDDSGITAASKIVVYDTNDKDADAVAKYLIEKGYKNTKKYNASAEINADGAKLVSYKNYKMNLERLAWQKHSIISLTDKMRQLRLAGKTSWEDMQSLLRSELGFWIHVKLRNKDEQTLRKTFDKYFVETAGEVVSLYNHNEKLASTAVGILNKRAYIDWISLDHTGAQVPLYVKGAGVEHFYECYDNTDIARAIAKSMGAKLER
jgi:alkaline phosphatase